ncbi:MAG: response regulator transcription factor [Treponema sp.]|nr:response regulator transcription factor [Treponema sp.]
MEKMEFQKKYSQWKATIAIVDDEKNVRLPVRKFLETEGFSVTEFSDGQAALLDLQSGNVPDLYILDIMMPVMDGIMFLREYKANFPDIPAIFLTSRDEEFDKVLGLELGADDYLTKPFSMKELAARVKVLLRRYKKISPLQVQDSLIKDSDKKDKEAENIVRKGCLFLDPRTFSAWTEKNGSKSEIALTVTEFRLLEHFMKNEATVFTREQLIQIAYPEDIYLNDRAIDCHIKRLRKKIGGEKIETVYGMGYKFIAEKA